jgi:tripartite-type tricarboxylate transporter receptor subunit TctC
MPRLLDAIRFTTLAALALTAPQALAQGYPNKPVRLVVTFPAGGAADALGRALAQKLGETLGQQVIVDNRPGAGGNLGTDLVAKSAADGYTLLLATNGTHGINPALYGKVPYDPVKDFAPIGLAQSLPSFFVVHPSFPAKNVREFLDYARARPGKLAYASAGNGTTSHLATELMKSQAQLFIVHIPYRGGAAAVTDLIAERVQLMIHTAPDTLPQIRAGKLRALGVSSGQRSALAPDIPTMAESGLAGFDVSSWTGLMAPAGTPREAVQRIAQALPQVAKAADYRERLAAMGADPLESASPEQFGAFVQNELAKWARAVKQSGAKVD